jgi:hypothetical protein
MREIGSIINEINLDHKNKIVVLDMLQVMVGFIRMYILAGQYSVGDISTIEEIVIDLCR